MSRITLITALVVLVAMPVAAQQETPEDVAMQYLALMRSRDWTGIARLTHPEAMVELRSLLDPLFTSTRPEADDFRLQLLGVRTAAEAQALSDTTTFINFLDAMGERVPAIDDVMRRATVEPIGHVARGDTAYVVYRTTITIENMPVSTLSVLPLLRAGDAWRGLLSGDFSSLATALRQALGG